MNTGRYEFPLSFAQQRLWFLDQLEGPSAVYTIRLPVRLNGPLDLAGLQDAVDIVMARHESLRTTFADRNGEPVQVIAPSIDVPVQLHALNSAIPDVIHERVGELSGIPFDLVKGPLFRVHVLRISSHEHLLLLLCHHIVSDAWSSGVLFGDLAAAYDAVVAGETLQAKELPVQYADYTVWQRNWMQGSELERQLKFWRAVLAGAPVDTLLPTDRPRPRQQTYNGSRLTRIIPIDLATALNMLARDNSCTLFMVAFAAFNVLLSRYTGQDDICVGSPIAGRRRTELEGLVGLFVNTLVLRTDLSGRPGFLELLARVRRSTLAAFAHQELPFEKLVEALQPVRDQSRSPLFQTMFILQNAPWEVQPIRGIGVEPGEAGPVATAKFDLTMSVNEYEDELWVNLEYNTDLFDEQTINRLADSYVTLLHEITKNSERPIHELELLSAEQHRDLADMASGNEKVFDQLLQDRDLTVHGLIIEQARRTPDAIALECVGQAWTYRKLDARAASLAECLVELLPRVGSPFIAVCTQRAPVMLTSILGVLQADAGYVPLDHTYPAQRIRHMLDDSDAGILVTQAGIIESLPAFDGAIVLLTDDGRVAEIRMPVVERSHASVVPPDTSIAYLIYTSGSTGRPKGVRIPHCAVVNFLLSMASEPGIAADDRLLAVTTLSFDIAVLELLLPLTVGATVIIAPTAATGDGHALDALMQDSAPTIMQATPATWRLLISAGWSGSPNLRILCGGESLDQRLARQLLESGGELWNMYGPTETTIWSTCEHIRNASAPITIGRPIANTTTCVLDANLEPVPVGVVGELFIGGHGLADGYHERSELTAERFIADPREPGGHLYRTGDRARTRNDGKLELLGRMDRQVKLRGFRIELGEVEQALCDLPAVSAAAVVLRDERLIAYVVSAANAKNGGVNYGNALRDRLPDHMVPTLFVELDALPLTPNGKVDRRQLPVLDSSAVAKAGAAPDQVAPRGPLEATLADLFADVLGVSEVGITDSFFDVGGHSLLATQLVSRIRDVLVVELPLRALFDEPTVAGLSGLLTSNDTHRRASTIADRKGRLVPRAAGFREQAPASLMQQRLWFLDQLEPGSSVYNLAWCLRLVGELDRSALEQAVRALVARHEILRTTFIADGGTPRQLITDKSTINVEFTALPAATDSALMTRLNKLAKQPFAIDVGPLMRVHVVETGNQEQVLLTVIHHIISDGWSMSVLFRELSAAYNAFSRGEPPSWLPLPVQYADYAVWQRDHLTGTELARQVGYWREQLAGVPPLLELPTDRPRPAVQSHRGARVSRMLTAELTAAVNGFARDEDSTLFMVLVATFAVVLGRYAGTHDVVVGTPIAGRGQTELEGLIGFFVNTLVLRTRLEGNPTVRDLLARVRKSALEAYANQDVPFEKLVDELRPERNTGRTPVFQVMFNLHNEPMHAVGFDALDAKPIGIDRGLAKFDLTVSISELARGLSVHLEYNTDLFTENTIGELADYYVQLLETFTAKPGLRLNSLPALTASVPAPVERTDWTGNINSHFVAQVRRAPKAIAVRTERNALSYGALNEQANAIAARLLSFGFVADPDGSPRIGLMCAPDTSLVVGLVGILKAGYAWVPLDPSWPAARLAALAQDADLAAIIADSVHVRQAGALSASLFPVVELDGEATDVDPRATIDDDALACIIYTSGSTGVPKGVMQTHRGIVTQVGRYVQALNLGPEDRLSGLSGFAYDASIQDIFGALLIGASVCLYDVHGEGEHLAENTALVAAMVADGITVMHAAPSLYRYLFGGDLNCSHDLSAVRLVVLGGEPVRRSDFELYRSRFERGTRFVNGLGLTESTLALQFHADHDTRLVGQSVPVGDAVAGLGVDLIDDNGEPGWCGEIVLTGAGLSPGYWRQPEQTAERFGPGPLLSTGDIGRRLPDGRIVIVGRRDEQLNIRGYRVEPGEIEAALGTLTGVSDCAVKMVERHGDPWLVAYVVTDANERPDTDALRDELSQRLPGYMVPQAIEWLDDLPRQANGKIARAELPVPRFDREAGLVLARTELEEKLLLIWSDVLQQEQFGVHDDFFALGGHSLLATRVIVRIRDQLKVDVPLINLFECPTIARLAESMTGSSRRETLQGSRKELISVTR